jgi:hypothetical protein
LFNCRLNTEAGRPLPFLSDPSFHDNDASGTPQKVDSQTA